MQDRGCDRIRLASSYAFRGQAGIINEIGLGALRQNRWSSQICPKSLSFKSFKAAEQGKLTVFASDLDTNVRHLYNVYHLYNVLVSVLRALYVLILPSQLPGEVIN